MIIHSYFTNGFYGWAKLFLESLGRRNGQDNLVVLDSINLSIPQIDWLYKCYRNLTIRNTEIDLKELAAKHDIDYEKFLKQKEEIETLHITPRSKNWKLLIAGDLRIKSILKMLNDYPTHAILHFDIDSYFRGSLDYLMHLARSKDICVRFRLDSVKENRKVLISTMTYKNRSQSRDFLNQWIKVIESKPLKQRPIGWGQTSYYRAYLKYNKGYQFGDIPIEYASARQHSNDIIWGGNSGAGKTINLQNFRKDFEGMT